MECRRTGRRRQLSSLKHQLYHPWLPTLRRMDMDTVLHRLAYEHSRHTCYCTREEFTNSKTTQGLGDDLVHCKNVGDPETKKSMEEYKSLKRSHSHYDQKLDDTTARALPNCLDHQSGFMVRRKHPNITASWREVLNMRTKSAVQNPMDKLTPATAFYKYRHTSRSYSTYPWY